jgi:hypothetical protein
MPKEPEHSPSPFLFCGNHVDDAFGVTIAQSTRSFDGLNPCYYDGSSLNASNAMLSLVNGGDSALWDFLDRYYQYVFNGKEYPRPTAYPKPERT